MLPNLGTSLRAAALHVQRLPRSVSRRADSPPKSPRVLCLLQSSLPADDDGFTTPEQQAAPPAAAPEPAAKPRPVEGPRDLTLDLPGWYSAKQLTINRVRDCAVANKEELVSVLASSDGKRFTGMGKQRLDEIVAQLVESAPLDRPSQSVLLDGRWEQQGVLTKRVSLVKVNTARPSSPHQSMLEVERTIQTYRSMLGGLISTSTVCDIQLTSASSYLATQRGPTQVAYFKGLLTFGLPKFLTGSGDGPGAAHEVQILYLDSDLQITAVSGSAKAPKVFLKPEVFNEQVELRMRKMAAANRATMDLVGAPLTRRLCTALTRLSPLGSSLGGGSKANDLCSGADKGAEKVSHGGAAEARQGVRAESPGFGSEPVVRRKRRDSPLVRGSVSPAAGEAAPEIAGDGAGSSDQSSPVGLGLPRREEEEGLVGELNWLATEKAPWASEDDLLGALLPRDKAGDPSDASGKGGSFVVGDLLQSKGRARAQEAARKNKEEEARRLGGLDS